MLNVWGFTGETGVSLARMGEFSEERCGWCGRMKLWVGETTGSWAVLRGKLEETVGGDGKTVGWAA